MNKSKKTVSEKSLNNLKPFSKGQSGNPNGRKPLTDEQRQARRLLKEANEELVFDLIERGIYQKLMIMTLENASALGSVQALKFLNEISGNKPKDEIEITNHINPLELIEKYEAILKAHEAN